MPRISSSEYLMRRLLLRAAWLDHPVLFTILPPNKQWEVHAYFRPSQDLGDEELLECRRITNKTNPGLAQQASRSYARLVDLFHRIDSLAKGDDITFNQIFMQLIPAVQLPKQKQRLKVAVLVKPEPNLRLLARALIALDGEIQAKLSKAA